MSGLVLDASSVLAWCFEDEAGAGADALVDRVATAGAVVPAIWSLEVTNALVVAERKRRITPEDSAAFIGMIGQLPIAVDSATASCAFGETLTLARTHGLSSYDAAYLELAVRSALPLATGDRQLARAAARLGVELC